MVSHILIWIVFNNIAGASNLTTSWGFAAWIETDSATILFDTGDKGEVLTKNISALGLDNREVDAIVISHPHWDHYGGLENFLEGMQESIPIYVPESALDKMQTQIPKAKFIAIGKAREIAYGIWSTGQLDGNYHGTHIPEHALVIDTREGLVIITGCSHPGIVNIVEHSHELFPDSPIHLVTGGFHLSSHSDEQVEAIADSLESLGVRNVAPSHCTGEKAIEIFRKRWGDNFIELYLGAKFEVGG